MVHVRNVGDFALARWVGGVVDPIIVPCKHCFGWLRGLTKARVADNLAEGHSEADRSSPYQGCRHHWKMAAFEATRSKSQM